MKDLNKTFSIVPDSIQIGQVCWLIYVNVEYVQMESNLSQFRRYKSQYCSAEKWGECLQYVSHASYFVLVLNHGKWRHLFDFERIQCQYFHPIQYLSQSRYSRYSFHTALSSIPFLVRGTNLLKHWQITKILFTILLF